MMILFGYDGEPCIAVPLFNITIKIGELTMFVLYIYQEKNAAFAYHSRYLHLVLLFITLTCTISFCYAVCVVYPIFIFTNK